MILRGLSSLGCSGREFLVTQLIQARSRQVLGGILTFDRLLDQMNFQDLSGPQMALSWDLGTCIGPVGLCQAAKDVI